MGMSVVYPSEIAALNGIGRKFHQARSKWSHPRSSLTEIFHQKEERAPFSIYRQRGKGVIKKTRRTLTAFELVRELFSVSKRRLFRYIVHVAR